MAEPLTTPDSTHGTRSYLGRWVGALMLDRRVFEEVERDPGALPQAASIVVLAGLARGAAASGAHPAIEILGSALSGIVLWLVASALVFGIGVRRLGYTSSFHELLRTLGFAAAPLLLLVAGVLPLGAAGTTVAVALHVWALLALVIAIREALDVSTRRALIVCLLALAVGFAVLFVLGSVLLAGGASEPIVG